MPTSRQVAALLAALLSACGGAADGELESWQRFQAANDTGRLVLQARDAPLRALARRLAAGLRTQTAFEVELADEIEPAADAIRIVLGTIDDPDVLELAQPLGLERLHDGGFRLLGRSFRSATDMVVATFDDPERPELPLILALGNDAERIASQLIALPLPWRPGLSAWSDAQPEFDVPLSTSGAPRADELLDYARRRADYWRDSEVRVDEGLTVRVKPRAVGMSPLRAYLRECLGARRRVQRWLGAGGDTEAQFFVYDHVEAFEDLVGPAELAHVALGERSIHALVARGVPDDAGAGLARVCAVEAAGAPSAPWMLDGIAVAAGRQWWSFSLDDWVGRLGANDLVPAVQVLIAPDASQRVSEHILLPSRGFLFQVLVDEVGPKRVREIWNEPGARLPARLRRAFEQAVDDLAQQVRPTAGIRRRRARSYQAPFRDGVALYDPLGRSAPGRSSYARRSVAESLAGAAELGANAVSLTVFATEESPVPALVRLEHRAVHGSASDITLASALAAARQVSLRSMLVIEPLSSPGGTWGDGLVMSDRPKIARFFESFTRIATHYALLSELCGVEILCLGSNLTAAEKTLVWDDREGDAHLRAIALQHWTELIAQVRRCYRGALTHGARSPSEVDQVGFWRQLDYIGLAMYPSFFRAEIPEDDRPVRRIMRREIDRALQFSELWERRLLFTQTGFPSRAEGWRRAHAPRGPLDLEQQRRFYSLLGDIMVKVRPGGALRGLYVWNWNVDPGAGGPADGGFTPQNKPAEAELPRLFESP